MRENSVQSARENGVAPRKSAKLIIVFTTKVVYMALIEHYIMSHMNEIAFSTVYEQLFAKENARE